MRRSGDGLYGFGAPAIPSCGDKAAYCGLFHPGCGRHTRVSNPTQADPRDNHNASHGPGTQFGFARHHGCVTRSRASPGQKTFPAARSTTSGALFQQGLLAQLRQRPLDLLERRLQSRTPVRIRRSCRQDLLKLQLQFLPRALFLPVDARSRVHRSGPLRLLFFNRLRLPTLRHTFMLADPANALPGIPALIRA
jgi:hypothetical protein